MATKKSSILNSPTSTLPPLTDSEKEYAIKVYSERKAKLAAERERLRKLLARKPPKRTRAQKLNWEYGGAKGNLMFAEQTIMNVRSAIERAGCANTVRAGLQFEEAEVLRALSNYARKIDMHYQVEMAIHQRKKESK